MTTPHAAANATASPDRRHFLSTLTAAGAIGTATIPALADAPGPIEVLYAKHLRIEADCDAASGAAMDAEEHYEEPKRPRWRPMQSAGRSLRDVSADDRIVLVVDDSPENVAALRAAAAEIHDPETNSLGYHAAERARTTLAEIEAWQAEVKLRKDACGLTAAEEAERRGWAASTASQDAIFAIEAATFRELACQAAILGIDWRHERGERVLARLVELAGVAPYGVA